MKSTPVTFILFGITGDLARKKLIPALLQLHKKKLLPEHYTIVGVGRREMDEQALIAHLGKEVAAAPEFSSHIVYHQGQLDDPTLYHSLATRLGDIDAEYGECGHKLFHISLAPEFFTTVLKQLHTSGLHISCVDSPGQSRIILEKPIGSDEKSAREINELLASLFDEKHIFRVDHYLMKKPVWTLPDILKVGGTQHIQSVRIGLFEQGDATGRGAFYDSMGAIRDVGQNHMLQMLALLNGGHIENDADTSEKGKMESRVGQYQGYAETPGVAPGSHTETYFKTLLTPTKGPLTGVPVTLEAGKALSENRVFVEIHYEKDIKEAPYSYLYREIQPTPSFRGISNTAGEAIIESTIESTPQDSLENYAKVYMDALAGDQSHFVSREEVEVSWKVIDTIRAVTSTLPLTIYPKGADPAGI